MTAAGSRGRSSGRSAGTHVRPWTAPPPGRASFHCSPSRLLGLGLARLPRNSHIPTAGCLSADGASHLPRESDTWKRRIPNCDPGRRGARGTTSPRKPRVGHAPCLFVLPVLPGPQAAPRQRRAPRGGRCFSLLFDVNGWFIRVIFLFFVCLCLNYFRNTH